MKLTLLTVLAMVLLSSPVWADCPHQEATVIFVNGVWTPLKDAVQHMKALERATRKGDISPDCVHFELSHTQDDGTVPDVTEVIVQKSMELNVGFPSLLLMVLRYIPPYSYFSGVTDVLFRHTEEVIETQLEKHLATVRELALDKSHRAVVVTHSQGGLYGNALWERLTASEQADTRLITVATPARDVADDGPNTRLTRDGVANRYFLAASVAGMIPNTGLCDKEAVAEADSWLCHGFETGYLHDPGARAQIVADIAAALPTGPVTLGVACGNPPKGMTGATYRHSFSATGGIPPYTFLITDGNVPDGLSLDAKTGTVAGIPQTAGTFTFAVQVRDKNHGPYPAGTTHCSWVDAAGTEISFDAADAFDIAVDTYKFFAFTLFINGVSPEEGSGALDYRFGSRSPDGCTATSPGYHSGPGSWFARVYDNGYGGLNPTGSGVIRVDVEPSIDSHFDSVSFYWTFGNGVVAPAGEMNVVGNAECSIVVLR